MSMKYSHFLEDILGKVTIDGFMVGTANNFKITKDYVIQRFKEFNERYFDNVLPITTIQEFKVFPYKNTLGSVVSLLYDSYSEIKSFRVSNYFNRSEKVYCDTILHEMIHVYQYTVLYPYQYNSNYDVHGKTFVKKMNEINSFGWNISVIESDEEYLTRGEKNVQVVKREEDNNDVNRYYLFVYVPQDTELIDSKYKGKVGFNIIDKMEAKALMNVLSLTLCQKSYFHPSKREIFIFEMKDNEFTKLLQRNDFLLPRRRIILKNLKNSKKRVDYIYDRTFSYNYNALLDLEEKGLIKNIGGKKLPKVGEKLTETRKSKLNRLEHIKKTIEKDPYVKVLGINDDGGVEIEVS